MTTITCFFYTETNNRPWPVQVSRGAFAFELEVEDATDIKAFWEVIQNERRGTSRSGVFEVQTPHGIWQHHNPAFVERRYGKLNPEKAVFVPWEEC